MQVYKFAILLISIRAHLVCVSRLCTPHAMIPPIISDDTRLERLLERCNDLQVGILHPHTFALHLQQNPGDLRLFSSVLPLLLASDRFELSIPSSQVVHALQRPEITIASIAVCKATTLAEASFLYSLHDEYVPSSVYRLKANARYFSQTLGWSHMMAASVLQTCLNCNPAFTSTTESFVTSSNVSLPSCHTTEFNTWISIFTCDATSAAADIMRNVDKFMQHRFYDSACSRTQTLNDDQQEVLAARLTSTLDINLQEASVSMSPQKRHVIIFLLTQHALSRNEQINWHIMSIAYAYLFRQCSIENDTRVWWSSLLVVITDLYNTRSVPQSRAMLVIPFLFMRQVLADDLVIQLLHLLSAIDDNFAAYAILSMFKRLHYYSNDVDVTIQCLSSILPLPEPIFQHVVDSLKPVQHQAFSKINNNQALEEAS